MLHPQLQADCHLLLDWPECIVLLHRNAVVPWFILVPRTEVADLLDLPPSQRERVIAEAAAVAQFIRTHWRLTKINFAQIGNVVPQMHVHIIGRAPGDDCWPRPVWGNLSQTRTYSEAELHEVVEQLRSLPTA